MSYEFDSEGRKWYVRPDGTRTLVYDPRLKEAPGAHEYVGVPEGDVSPVYGGPRFRREKRKVPEERRGVRHPK